MFDPVHNGHLDIVERAQRLFDEVWVVVARNPAKRPLFSAEERVRLFKSSVVAWPKVHVEASDELTVRYAARRGAHVLIRGLRAVLDYDYEVQMALMNRHLEPSLESLFMVTASQYSYLSSSLVKQVGSFHGALNGLVPEHVQEAMIEKFPALEGQHGR